MLGAKRPGDGARLLTFVVNDRRLSAASRASAVSFPFSIARFNCFSIPDRPR